jgi:hypothetical protein
MPPTGEGDGSDSSRHPGENVEDLAQTGQHGILWRDGKIFFVIMTACQNARHFSCHPGDLSLARRGHQDLQQTIRVVQLEPSAHRDEDQIVEIKAKDHPFVLHDADDAKTHIGDARELSQRVKLPEDLPGDRPPQRHHPAPRLHIFIRDEAPDLYIDIADFLMGIRRAEHCRITAAAAMLDLTSPDDDRRDLGMIIGRMHEGNRLIVSVGWLTSARAMATRCCWPPESSFGRCSRRSDKPTRSSASIAHCLRSRRDSPA